MTVEEFIKKWDNDPTYWTNNKRKMHGLKVRRGKYNKNYFKPAYYELFNDAMNVCDNLIVDSIYDKINQFANIEGDKFYFKGDDLCD